MKCYRTKIAKCRKRLSGLFGLCFGRRPNNSPRLLLGHIGSFMKFVAKTNINWIIHEFTITFCTSDVKIFIQYHDSPLCHYVLFRIYIENIVKFENIQNEIGSAQNCWQRNPQVHVWSVSWYLFSNPPVTCRIDDTVQKCACTFKQRLYHGKTGIIYDLVSHEYRIKETMFNEIRRLNHTVHLCQWVF